jgi:hypothetical protein
MTWRYYYRFPEWIKHRPDVILFLVQVFIVAVGMAGLVFVVSYLW